MADPIERVRVPLEAVGDQALALGRFDGGFEAHRRVVCPVIQATEAGPPLGSDRRLGMLADQALVPALSW